ncbi:MAG: hypothetical protein JWN25_535, partial [Verrucomicrobiales bacterium]|nr:hypothetical protein [Verrucomicrobiales bacterium]
ADGSLLIVDTGGWYKLCCPSSQLAKPDVLGAIFRVKKKGTRSLTPDERRAAYQKLAQPPSLADYALPATLKKAVWKNDPANAKWFREILEKNSKSAATNAESAHIVRTAAEGLGRLRDKTAVAALLESARYAGADPFLEHTLVYALVQIGDPVQTRLGLKSSFTPVQKAAMTALDQMDSGRLEFIDILPALKNEDKELRKSAIWILKHHLSWNGFAADFVEELLKATPPSKFSEDRKELLKILASSPQVQDIFATNFTTARMPDKIAFIVTVSQAHPQIISDSWLNTICDVLSQNDAALRDAALESAHQLNSNKRPAGMKLQNLLLGLAADQALVSDVRVDALFGTWGVLEPLPPDVVDLLLSSLNPKESALRRSKALQVLLRTRLSAADLGKASEMLPNIGPLELLKFLEVFEGRDDVVVGQSAVTALQKSKAARSLPAGNLKAIFARYPDSVQSQLAFFLKTLDSGAPQQSAHLDALLADLKKLNGDSRKGQFVFNSAKASCMACHKVGYVGGNIGPDLTSVGTARSERDLLESIVYPSASFVRSFEPVLITTKQGEVQSGIIKRDTSSDLLLATGANAEVKIAKADIADQKPGTVSIMPQGLDEQLSRQELADLLAFLKNTK